MPVGEISADAVPMLSAAESPMLLLEDRRAHQLVHFPVRRKSSLPGGDAYTLASASSTSESTTSTHSRRRGASIPPSTSSSSSSSTSSSSPLNAFAPSATISIGPPPGSTTTSRRRGFTLSRKFLSRRDDDDCDHAPQRRRVTFKASLHPEVVPAATLLSYDELLFNVAGLYQTTSYLHEPEDFGDPPCPGMDDLPPLERSVPLMIAEFLYRSAVYLGYPTGDKPWIPGFRETKRFSSNDVRRWRRLAHFDWDREEREFERKHCPDANNNGGYRVDEPPVASTGIPLPSEASKPRGRARLRAAVSRMVKLRRPRSRDDGGESTDEDESSKAAATQKIDMERPPPVDPHKARSGELDLLVTIVNSCVYCGAFRFRARDIITLCNVDIDQY